MKKRDITKQNKADVGEYASEQDSAAAKANAVETTNLLSTSDAVENTDLQAKADVVESTDLQAKADATQNADLLSTAESAGSHTLWQKAISYFKSMPKRFFISALSGMAIGLFCTLIAGTIIQTIGLIFQSFAPDIYIFLQYAGHAAKVLMGAGIGAGIAYSLKAPKMVVICAAVAGFVGANASFFIGADFAATNGKDVVYSNGNPLSSYVCALIATELGILVSGKTKLDILVVPLVTILAGSLIAILVGKPLDGFVNLLSEGMKNINIAMQSHAEYNILFSILISMIMGILLTLPTSSAAIGVIAGLSGLAAGAAVVGCCCHMVGFAVSSFRENKWGGLISQGLGTSMLQIPNLTRKPQILIPPVVASIVVAPIATLVFGLQCDAIGSGMGTSGLVGVIETIKVSAENGVGTLKIIFGVALCCFVLPAAISLLVSEFMRRKKWIKHGYMKLED